MAASGSAMTSVSSSAGACAGAAFFDFGDFVGGVTALATLTGALAAGFDLAVGLAAGLTALVAVLVTFTAALALTTFVAFSGFAAFLGTDFFWGMIFLTVLETTFLVVFTDLTVFLADGLFATRGGFFVATDLAFLFGFGEVFLVMVLTDLPGDPGNAVTN